MNMQRPGLLVSGNKKAWTRVKEIACFRELMVSLLVFF